MLRALWGFFVLTIFWGTAAAAEPTPPVWQAWAPEYNSNGLVKLGTSWPPIEPTFSTPEAACASAVQWVAKNENGTAATYTVGPYEEAILIIFTPSGQRTTYAGRKCKIYDADGATPGDSGADDDWAGWKRVVLQPVCPSTGSSPTFVDGKLLCAPSSPPAPPPCECNPGDTPLSSPPDVKVGNPISLDNGEKRQTERDYESADGLLAIDRTYRSNLLPAGSLNAVSALPGFSEAWHGVVPGRLTYSEANQTLQFMSASGSKMDFGVSDSSGAAVFNAYTPTRLRLATVSAVSSWNDYIRAAASTGNAGEIRLSYSNGGYLLFKRADSFDTVANIRSLVVTEQGFAGGYKLFFNYSDTSEYPTSITDSYGRNLTLSWTDIGWASKRLRSYHKGPEENNPGSDYVRQKAISAIGLKDGTSLEYTYGVSEASGWKGRLTQAARKNANGVALWTKNYAYENANLPLALTAVSNASGTHLSEYTYDSFGRVTSSSRLGGFDRVDVAYGADDMAGTPRVRTVTNALGMKTEYTYSGFSGTTVPSRLIGKKVDLAAGANATAMVYNYDYNGTSNYANNTGNVDGRGIKTAITNDTSRRRPLSVVLASGLSEQQSTSYTWHSTFDLPLSIARAGLTTSFTYDSTGQVLTRTERDTTNTTVPYSTSGQTRTWTYTWTAGGKISSINGPKALANNKDDKFTYSYDVNGNLLSETNGLGQAVTFSGYDANGRPALVTDPNGAIIAYSYDALGRVKTITAKHPSDTVKDAVTSINYDAEGRVIAVAFPMTEQLYFDYNSYGLLASVRTASGERIDYTTNEMGGVLSETTKQADGTVRRTVSRTFDGLNRMLTLTLGENRTSTYAYDSSDNIVKTTTARGVSTTFAFDGINRLSSTISPAAGTTTETYNGNDYQLSHTDAIAVKTSYVRNGFGDIISEVSPDRGSITNYYDLAGDVTASIDGRGQRINYVRDVLGRILTKTPVNRPTSEIVTYSYDTGGIGSYQIGRLTKIVDGTGTTSFQYDHRGNLLTKRQAIGSSTAADLAYEYDLANRITRITYPSGRTVDYARDGKGRVTAVSTKASASAAVVTLASGLQYDPFGSLTSATFGNGLSLAQNWGNDARLVSKRLYNTTTGANVSSLRYGYNINDDLVSIEDLVDASKNLAYQYDDAGRLNRTDLASGNIRRQDIVYDANGNRLRIEDRTSAADTNPTSTTTYAIASGKNQISAISSSAGTRSITYDGRGNTSAESRPGSVSVQAAYDGYGRLISYQRTGITTIAQTYNGLNDRVSVTSGSDTRRFVSDGDGRLLAEYGTAVTDVKAETIWMSPTVAIGNQPFGGGDGVDGYAPLAVVVAGQVYWIHGNHLGVPLVSTSASGAVTNPSGYTRVGFPGQTQTLADLYYNRNRDYDPTTGRYIQADPIGLDGGENPYVYALNNPIRWTDPWGLAPRRQLDPNSEECKALAKKIENIRKDIEKRKKEVAENPNNLPEFAPGGKPRDSVEGHREIIRELEKTLSEREQLYADKCGGGNCGDGVKTVAKVGVGVGGAYIAYRVIRFLPSLFPPLWETIPVNLAVP